MSIEWRAPPARSVDASASDAEAGVRAELDARPGAWAMVHRADSRPAARNFASSRRARWGGQYEITVRDREVFARRKASSPSVADQARRWGRADARDRHACVIDLWNAGRPTTEIAAETGYAFGSLAAMLGRFRKAGLIAPRRTPQVVLARHAEVVRRREAGESVESIARATGYTASTVRSIAKAARAAARKAAGRDVDDGH